jgi:hypothetical protein
MYEYKKYYSENKKRKDHLKNNNVDGREKVTLILTLNNSDTSVLAISERLQMGYSGRNLRIRLKNFLLYIHNIDKC